MNLLSLRKYMPQWFLMALSFIAGMACLHQFEALPNLSQLLICLVLCCLAYIAFKYFVVGRGVQAVTQSLWTQAIGWLLLVTIGFLFALSYGTWRAEERLAERLAQQHDDRVSRLVVLVSDLVTYGDDYLQFDAEVLRSKPVDGIPKYIQLRWSFGAFVGPYQQRPPLSESMPEIKPGEVWSFAVNLRRPWGSLNPGQRDILAHRFANNHRAVGQIKGMAQQLDEPVQWSWSVRIARLRHDLRATLNQYLGDKRYGPVMVALVMGDQAGIAQDDWVLFNRSGLTHLVSISGSHITMLSSLASLLSFLLWRRLRVGAGLVTEKIPAQRIAGVVGIMVAFAYCSIAGWGVPAQRSFLMLAIFFLNFSFGLQWSIHHVLALAAVLVLLLEPWAILSVGFWLSFGAMLVLILLVREVLRGEGIKQKITFTLRSWAKMQLAIFIGLAPFLATIFNQISLISPIANAYAIFLIGTLITPASLLLALTAQFDWLHHFNHWWADLVHALLYYTLEFTAALANWSYALWDITALPLWAVILSLFAILSLLIARFSQWTSLALLWLIPIFMGFGSTSSLRQGEWQAYALDIGQGSAILISTANHHLLFDVGPRTGYEFEATNRVIIPALRALGVRQLDRVVVSHSDLDHVGGFSELISQVPVGHVYSSFDMSKWLAKEEQIFDKDYTPQNKELQAQACVTGEEFIFDGVRFSFLWPDANSILPLRTKSANEESCVLLVEGTFHSLLLTGDIDVAVEHELLARQAVEQVDVVVVSHHGSMTSSAPAFVEAVQAQAAVAQAGHYNRYNHPDPRVKQHWLGAGSRFYSTIEHGAVRFRSTALSLEERSEKGYRRRYWH